MCRKEEKSGDSKQGTQTFTLPLTDLSFIKARQTISGRIKSTIDILDLTID